MSASWLTVWSGETLIAARYHANRIDRINTARDAAEHDPGTPEAWADGCTCPRQDPLMSAYEFDVTYGCPMHDPEDW